MTTYDWVGGNGNFNNPQMWKDAETGTVASYDPNGQNPVVINTDKDITIDTTPYSYSDQWGSSYPNATTAPQSVTFSGTGTVTVTGSGGVVSYGTISVGDGQTVVLDGTTMSASKTVSGGTIKLENAANLSVNTSLDTTTIDFGGNSTKNGHNTVTLGSGSYSIKNIKNFSPDDSIVIKNQYGYTNVEWVKTGTNTYSLIGVDQYGNTSTSAGNSYIATNVSFAQSGTDKAGNPTYYTPSDLYGGGTTGTVSSGEFAGDTYYLGSGLSSNSDGTMVITCFLSGSMIRTANGDIAVEDLQIGDQIIAFDWKKNKNVARSVVWAGKAHATVQAGLPLDEAGYPVRILKNAISKGVPYKDMLITAEHCLFFEGNFVPARMLVNGRSIFYDTSITSYDYYHVETEEHSVITADGMLTESYLDTGNRASFRQDTKIASLHATGTLNWQNDAAAPLCVDRKFVEALFRSLETQGKKVANCQTPAASGTLTHNPDLHLVLKNGAVIRPIRQDGQNYSFMIPAGVDSVRILSRTSRPSDVVGPFVDDRRYLGVAVGAIHFMNGKKQTQITAHLDGTVHEGWHEASSDANYIWTKGNALLPLCGKNDGKMGLLIISALPAENYRVETEQSAALVRHSA
ncbi:Hint domain-containing protein [Acetobacter malorum]|uniref:Hint domain-containing protein n=1 Tax=Acetobacter malorum TaxID=178901 RepID=UPI00248F3833|nr:Hint domain-containing protein [Acetobacter malorum]